MFNYDGRRRGGTPIVAFALGGLVAAAAALGARPVLTGARWSPAVTARSAPPNVPHSAPPQPDASAEPTVAPQPTLPRDAHLFDTTWLIVIGTVVLGALVVLAVLYALRHRRRRFRPKRIGVTGLAVDMTTDPSAEVGKQHIRHGLVRALEMLSEDRDPSDAVTAAWLGLQESAHDAGFLRGPAETPTEFTTRILRQLDVDEDALGTLRRCYLAVRFGGAPATESDVDAVRAALRTLEQQWAVSPTGRS